MTRRTGIGTGSGCLFCQGILAYRDSATGPPANSFRTWRALALSRTRSLSAGRLLARRQPPGQAARPRKRILSTSGLQVADRTAALDLPSFHELRLDAGWCSLGETLPHQTFRWCLITAVEFRVRPDRLSNVQTWNTLYRATLVVEAVASHAASPPQSFDPPIDWPGARVRPQYGTTRM